MAFKVLLAVCASVCLAQSTMGQSLGRIAAPCGLAAPVLAAPALAGGYGAGCGGVASTGGGLPVSSTSCIAPVGVSVVSENAYEGVLAAGGNLPFLGTVAVEGVLPTAGGGAISYGCGDGAVGIVAEDGPIFTGIIAPETFAPAAGLAASGYGLAGIDGYGLGGIAGYGLAGIDGYGLGGINGYGLGGNAGYGIGGLGCGYGAIY